MFRRILGGEYGRPESPPVAREMDTKVLLSRGRSNFPPPSSPVPTPSSALTGVGPETNDAL